MNQENLDTFLRFFPEGSTITGHIEDDILYLNVRYTVSPPLEYVTILIDSEK